MSHTIVFIFINQLIVQYIKQVNLFTKHKIPECIPFCIHIGESVGDEDGLCFPDLSHVSSVSF